MTSMGHLCDTQMVHGSPWRILNRALPCFMGVPHQPTTHVVLFSALHKTVLERSFPLTIPSSQAALLPYIATIRSRKKWTLSTPLISLMLISRLSSRMRWSLRPQRAPALPKPTLLEGETESIPFRSHSDVLRSTQGTLEERTRPEVGHSKSTSTYDAPVHRLPIEILLVIFKLVTPSSTREDLYTTLDLTLVCRLWRTSLIGYPGAWTSIFATQWDHPSFIEACFKRSQPYPVEVTVDLEYGRRISDSNCHGPIRETVIRTKEFPFEWHDRFKLLSRPSNAERIQVLRGTTSCILYSLRESEGQKFLRPYLLQLTTLEWMERWPAHAQEWGRYARRFPDNDIVLKFPKLRSLTFCGPWNASISNISNLTSFALKGLTGVLNIDRFRQFFQNNQTLVSLEVSNAIFGGRPKAAPACLPSLKSLTMNDSTRLSAAIHIPAFQRLSTLQVSSERDHQEMRTFCATGDGFSLAAKLRVHNFRRYWVNLTRDARPTIYHLRMYDEQPDCVNTDCILHTLRDIPIEDATTLDIGLGYSRCLTGLLWDDLKSLELQLKTIRFEISEKFLPYGQSGDISTFLRDSDWWDRIVELVKVLSEKGQPLSAVERMVVSEDEEINRLQDVVWEQFLESNDIARFLLPE